MNQLLSGLENVRIAGDPQSEISSLTDDSRRVTPGSLFVAVRGTRADGRAFVQEALQRGAVAVVLEEKPETEIPPLAAGGGAWVLVPDAQRALGFLADAFWRHPSRRLSLVGITGTNGKTTTAFLVEAVLRSAGKKTGLIGTVRWGFDSRWEPAPQTTPGVVALQSRLGEMADRGVEFCVMEVSSHALTQHRVWGCRFAAAVFTNLTQDHLDYHRTMAAYFEAKARLFTEYSLGAAVINRDDPWGEKLMARCRVPVFSYSAAGAGDFTLSRIRSTLEGVAGVLHTPVGEQAISTRLVGGHNVANILAAAATCHALGLDLPVIVRGVAALDGVPGRFEKVDEGQEFGVVVDYAHTDDALRRLLTAARELKPRRLIVLFGCGGDRDRGKRPLMGEAAAELADLLILTSDNPRSEDPGAILQEIEAGVRRVSGKVDYCRLADRRQAIARAISEAAAGDLVVIAGKGHETEQIIGERRYPFDDREVAREFLRLRVAKEKGLKGGGGR